MSPVLPFQTHTNMSADHFVVSVFVYLNVFGMLGWALLLVPIEHFQQQCIFYSKTSILLNIRFELCAQVIT